MALGFAEAEQSFRRTRGNLDDPRDGNIQKSWRGGLTAASLWEA